MIFLGKRKTQKVRTSIVVTVPSVWIKQFEPDKIKELYFYTNEDLDLVVKVQERETDNSSDN